MTLLCFLDRSCGSRPGHRSPDLLRSSLLSRWPQKLGTGTWTTLLYRRRRTGTRSRGPMGRSAWTPWTARRKWPPPLVQPVAPGRCWKFCSTHSPSLTQLLQRPRRSGAPQRARGLAWTWPRTRPLRTAGDQVGTAGPRLRRWMRCRNRSSSACTVHNLQMLAHQRSARRAQSSPCWTAPMLPNPSDGQYQATTCRRSVCPNFGTHPAVVHLTCSLHSLCTAQGCAACMHPPLSLSLALPPPHAPRIAVAARPRQFRRSHDRSFDELVIHAHRQAEQLATAGASRGAPRAVGHACTSDRPIA